MLDLGIAVRGPVVEPQLRSAACRDGARDGLCHAQAYALPAVVLAVLQVDEGLLRAPVHGGAHVVLAPAVVERGAVGSSNVVVSVMRSQVKVVRDGANSIREWSQLRVGGLKDLVLAEQDAHGVTVVSATGFAESLSTRNGHEKSQRVIYIAGSAVGLAVEVEMDWVQDGASD